MTEAAEAQLELYGLIGAAAYFLACVIVGGRLALLARRTGERPELLFGAAFLSGGAIGYPLLVASAQITANDPAAARPYFYAGTALAGVSAVLLVAFWRRVYQPGSTAARGAIYAFAVAIYASLAMIAVSAVPGASVTTTRWYLVNLACQGVPYALNAFSGGRLYGALRRRVPLGLEEPLVANRVALWALGAAAIAGQYVYVIARLVIAGPDAKVGAAGPDTIVISTLGLVCGVAMFLAFFPNASYRDWVERRAAARG